MSAYAVTSQKMADWADSLERELERVQEAGRAPHQIRVFRTLRYTDVKDFADGITPKRWERWISEREHVRAGQIGSKNSPFRITLAQLHEMQEYYGVRPKRPENKDPFVVAVSQFKGGSAKTSTTLNLAMYLAMRGYRVCVQDWDAQATYTRMMGLNPSLVQDEETAGPAFLDPDDIESRLRPMKTHVDGLDIVPASMALNQLDIALALEFRDQTPQSRVFYSNLGRSIETIKKNYDFILLDTPPAFSLTQTAVMWGVNSLLVPLPPEGPDMGGMVDFLRQTSNIIKSVEQWDGQQKVWDPFVILHTRDKGIGHAEVLKALAAGVFGVNRLTETCSDIKVVSAAHDLFKSVYEAHTDELNALALKRAREAFNKTFRTLTSIYEEIWANG